MREDLLELFENDELKKYLTAEELPKKLAEEVVAEEAEAAAGPEATPADAADDEEGER
jgi:succinate dehydrogenase / fumarate reductase flavoprotein subunit